MHINPSCKRKILKLDEKIEKKIQIIFLMHYPADVHLRAGETLLRRSKFINLINNSKVFRIKHFSHFGLDAVPKYLRSEYECI